MHQARDERGVTLVELMVSLALAAMIMAAVVILWTQSQQAYMEGAEAADTQQRVRLAMDQMVKAIQQAGANPTNKAYADPSVPPITNNPAFTAFRGVGANCLQLYSDVTGDGTVQQTQENIFFNWNGPNTDLTVQEGGGPDLGQVWVAPPGPIVPIAVNIVANPNNDPIFRYFTGPSDPTPNVELPLAQNFPCANTMTNANRARIGRIVITLTAQGQVGNQVVRRTLVSEARPRNVP
jgi:prepilin-type N-terminal cleavage/methylation domain-containing protein